MGWLGWGFSSSAEWLHYRCDISLSAAREKVRVAHALKTLPAIGRAFAEGKLSYSKVRVMVHVEESALRGGAGRSGLPIETVRRLACHNDLVVLVEDRN